MRVPIDPRPLSASERSVVEHLLQVDFPGAAELRAQLDCTEVVAQWAPGSVSIDLRVKGVSQAAPIESGVAPVEATVVDAMGNLFGEIILWTQFGMLSGVEYAWYGEDPPTSFPEIGKILLSPRK